MDFPLSNSAIGTTQVHKTRAMYLFIHSFRRQVLLEGFGFSIWQGHNPADKTAGFCTLEAQLHTIPQISLALIMQLTCSIGWCWKKGVPWSCSLPLRQSLNGAWDHIAAAGKRMRDSSSDSKCILSQPPSNSNANWPAFSPRRLGMKQIGWAFLEDEPWCEGESLRGDSGLKTVRDQQSY